MCTSNNVVLPLLFASILVTGCGRGPEVPLDNRTLDVMTRTRIVEAHVVFGDVSFFTCRGEHDIKTYRSLLSSLIPVSSHANGELTD